MVYNDDNVLDFWVCSDFGFEGLPDNCNGRKVIKIWEGQMSLQAGHGLYFEPRMGVWLISQMSGKIGL